MKYLVITLLIVAALVGGGYMIGKSNSPDAANSPAASNTTIADGKQIIEIRARGGYQPRKSVAKAGVPTTLRFITNGTFDCSASIRIPSLNITQLLPQTGSTDIALGAQPPGTLQGTCGMGMYPFTVDFKA